MTDPGGATLTCPTCSETVPAGVFCGACGHHLTRSGGPARTGFRGHSYAAAPGEHVLRLSVVSSLFPHLPHRSRAPFRIAVVVLAVALVVLAALRLQAPMIAISALGVPLLFQLYLMESDVYDDLPTPLLGLAVALGAGLGYGWAELTADHVSTSIGSALLGGADTSRFWTDGVLIPLGTVLTFFWVHTFKLGIFPEAIIPFCIGFLTDAANAAGDITATEEASLLETDGPRHDERIQGGLMGDGKC